jgi:hypothetical protein
VSPSAPPPFLGPALPAGRIALTPRRVGTESEERL